jgi:hypothetical protein
MASIDRVRLSFNPQTLTILNAVRGLVMFGVALELRGNAVFAYSHHKRLVEDMLAEYRTQHPARQQVVLHIGTILGPTGHIALPPGVAQHQTQTGFGLHTHLDLGPGV